MELTSKQRAYLRGLANTIPATQQIGKDGVTESVAQQAALELKAKELIKIRVLESALLTAREASDQLCQMTGAEGVSCVGNTFVLYRHSKKLEAQRAQQKAKERAAKKVNPVKAGVQARRKQAKAEKQRKQKYYHDAAVKAAIERRKQSEQ